VFLRRPSPQLNPAKLPAWTHTQDPYKAEPARHPALLVRSKKPFNGETPPEMLAAAPITPLDMFYVRHHLPVPVVDEQKYELKVGGVWMGTVLGALLCVMTSERSLLVLQAT
jgi:hypothetical protein